MRFSILLFSYLLLKLLDRIILEWLRFYLIDLAMLDY